MEKLKMFVNKENLNEEELKTGRVSYQRVVKRYIGDLVLCNNIENLDESIFDNASNLYNEETEEYEEIYQYYLCNIGEWEKEQLMKAGIIISYSNMLDCDILMVDHFGTSWDYVMTDVDWAENLEEC